MNPAPVQLVGSGFAMTLSDPFPVFSNPDLDWIRIQLGQRIRMSAGQNWNPKKGKKEISCTKSQDVLCRGLSLRRHMTVFDQK